MKTKTNYFLKKIKRKINNFPEKKVIENIFFSKNDLNFEKGIKFTHKQK